MSFVHKSRAGDDRRNAAVPGCTPVAAPGEPNTFRSYTASVAKSKPGAEWNACYIVTRGTGQALGLEVKVADLDLMNENNNLSSIGCRPDEPAE
jgi:hypothetical protein